MRVQQSFATHAAHLKRTSDAMVSCCASQNLSLLSPSF